MRFAPGVMKITSVFSFASVLLFGVVTLPAAPKTFTATVSGHGRPMILIPGLACPGAVWDKTVAEFSSTFECHVVILAGFAGAPAAPVDRPLLETVREELASYIEDHRLAKPVLVGHSLGGFIALDLAAHHPETPGPLVIVDSLPYLMQVMRPNATPEQAKQLAEITADSVAKMTSDAYSKMIRSGPNGSTMASGEEDLDRIVRWGLASDNATVAKAMKEMYLTDLRAGVASIKSPTLVLAAWIGYSPYSSHEIAARLYGEQYSKLPGVRIQVSDTARHFIMLDDPAWLSSQMHAFLASASPAK